MKKACLLFLMMFAFVLFPVFLFGQDTTPGVAEYLIIALAGKYPVLLTVIALLGLVVPLASFIANLTPTDRDDKVVAVLVKINDWLALNFTVRKY
jgi:hypothetical protein